LKLATLKDGTRDGRLIVVNRDSSAYTLATPVALTLQAALDDWAQKEPQLRTLADQLEAGAVQSRPLDVNALLAPLPRAYEWVDGSAFLNHVILVRKARNAEPPATLKTDPLVYQGGSGEFLAPTADIPLGDET
jgi:fumarylacetoacetate (FAA) hydrolase